MAVYLAGNGLEQKVFARIHVHLAVKHQVNPRNDAGYIKVFILRNKHITIAIYKLRFFKIALSYSFLFFRLTFKGFN